MAWAAGDGPPDLVAKHVWVPDTGSSPPTINDSTTTPPTFPWIRLMGITGWRALPESEDIREARTVGEGEITYPSRKLGKTLVYEVAVHAADVQTLSSTMTGLMRGFGDMNGEGVMTVTPLSSFGGGVAWTFSARVIDLNTDPSWDFHQFRHERFTWGAAITLRMSDPYFYTGGVAYL